MKYKFSLFLIPVFLFFSSLVIAHEPGADVVSSDTRRYIFYIAGIVFIATLMNWLMSLLTFTDEIKKTISRIILVASIIVVGYLLYHWFVE